MSEKKYPEFGVYFTNLVESFSNEKNQEMLAECLMTTQSTISKIKNGMTLPSKEMVKQIAILWGVDISDYVEKAKDKYENWKSEGKRKGFEPNDEPNNKEVTKPRLPITAAAGTLSDYLGGVLAHECEQIPIIRSMPDYDFTMIVKGDSMEPKFEGGDEIACKKVNSLIEPGKTYVLSTRDGAVLKRIYPEEDGVRCVSYNHEEYPDFKVNGEDILGVYRVVGLIRI